jgi:predicted nucleotidyltransferase
LDLTETPIEKVISTIVNVADPDRIILFGSHAKGESGSERDDDFLILKKGVKKPRELGRLIYRNVTKIGVPVDIIVSDVIVSDIDQYEQNKDNPYSIYAEAEKYGRVLYEKS